MLTKARAIVLAITSADANHVLLSVQAENEAEPRTALAYPSLTGPVHVGDMVVLNTTATTLKLGTGGVDFVIHNESRPLPDAASGADEPDAHIVKLRYTPLQHAVAAVETNPAHAAVWERAQTLLQTPVVALGLHSQLAPAAAAVKAARPDARVAYVMTDAAALGIGFSALVRDLKAAGLLDATLTAGQAFGGDYECVTVASGLLAARWIARADVILVGQGPGNAGTGTRFGFSGIEQGPLLDMAGRLWGTPIAPLRLSLADKRARHAGLSHHSVTTLGLLAQSPALIAFPAENEDLPEATLAPLREAVENSPIARTHTIMEADGTPGMALLARLGVRVTSMGRAPDQDTVFFHAAAAAGALAASHIRS